MNPSASNPSLRTVLILIFSLASMFVLLICGLQASFRSKASVDSVEPLIESSITNEASVFSKQGSKANLASFGSSNRLSARLVAMQASPNITATRSHSPAGNSSPGATRTYSITISNITGTADALGVNFTDTIDPNTALVAGSVAVSPIAVNDTYNTIGNVNIDVPAAQGLLANDLNPNGCGALTILTPPTTTTGGGALSINPTTGAFTYNPPVNYRMATNTFTYTLGNGTGKTGDE